MAHNAIASCPAVLEHSYQVYQLFRNELHELSSGKQGRVTLGMLCSVTPLRAWCVMCAPDVCSLFSSQSLLLRALDRDGGDVKLLYSCLGRKQNYGVVGVEVGLPQSSSHVTVLLLLDVG